MMKYWLIALLALTVAAQADVTRKHTSKSTVHPLGTNKATTSDYYASDRSASESETKWSRGFMKTMTRGKKVEERNIIRLDKELIWSLDLKKETYTENDLLPSSKQCSNKVWRKWNRHRLRRKKRKHTSRKKRG